MEDYKEKYKLALNRAKGARNSAKSDKENGVTDKITEYTIQLTETIFPELKESEEEEIRNEIIQSIQDNMCVIHKDKCIAWLEKQDPKKHEEELEKAYKCADEVQYRKGYEDAKREIENQNEQKTTDEVKPKFKVGDWVAFNICDGSDFVHIMGIDNKNYEIEVPQGFTGISSIGYIDNNYHSFTIQDAKEGDVLCTHSSESDSDCVFLYQNTYEIELNRNVAVAHCCIDVCANKIEFGIQGPDCIDVRNVKPATKEQCDLLFQKMKEAGYEWDDEKKELKKMEQEQTELPNGKDYGIDGLYHAVRILEKTLGGVEGYQSDDGILEHKCAIEAVKRLYKQKPAWSEDDEKVMTQIIFNLEKCTIPGFPVYVGGIELEINWLKSLKERYTWKPSDEQMNLLEYLVEDNNQRYFYNILRSLYEQLKKLKEE